MFFTAPLVVQDVLDFFCYFQDGYCYSAAMIYNILCHVTTYCNAIGLYYMMQLTSPFPFVLCSNYACRQINLKIMFPPLPFPQSFGGNKKTAIYFTVV